MAITDPPTSPEQRPRRMELEQRLRDAGYPIRKFLEMKHGDEDLALSYNALATIFVETHYPGRTALEQSALKWAFIAGLTIGRQIEQEMVPQAEFDTKFAQIIADQEASGASDV